MTFVIGSTIKRSLDRKAAMIDGVVDVVALMWLGWRCCVGVDVFSVHMTVLNFIMRTKTMTVMMTVITKVVATVLRAILKVAFTPEVSRAVKAEHRDFFL